MVRLFRRMQGKVRNKLTKRQYENDVSWSTSVWLALQAQRLSVAVHIASAWDGDRDTQRCSLLGVGARRLPLLMLRRAPRHGVSPHRTLSGHVVCLFVFVIVCASVCVLSSRCLVCRPSPLVYVRVGTPPARVNTYSSSSVHELSGHIHGAALPLRQYSVL